jgi:hypothetical protein
VVALVPVLQGFAMILCGFIYLVPILDGSSLCFDSITPCWSLQVKPGSARVGGKDNYSIFEDVGDNILMYKGRENLQIV